MSSTGLLEIAGHSGARAARTRNLAPQLRDSGFVLRTPRNDGVTISAIHLQRGNERFLRDVDLAELPHLLLAFLLLFQKFAFARDVAAIAFGGDVLAQRADGFAGDHL